MSSFSAGLSAYDAAEPKPMNSAANSVRSSKSKSSRSNYSPAPPPPRPAGSSVANSYRSQPKSVDGRSSQSVASGLSLGSAGRLSRQVPMDDDDQSNNTARLVGLVNELTRNGGEDDEYEMERRRQMEEERYRLQDEIRHQMDDDNYSDHHSRQLSRRSRDPESDEASRRSNMSGVPPPPRSVRSGHSQSHQSRSRYDPDGMSHDFGADDPDGRHYAPGLNNHGGVPSVHTGIPPMDEESHQGSQSYYGEDQSTLRSTKEEESYYSRDSRSRQSSTVRSVPAPPPRLSAEMSQFSGAGEDESYYSRQSRGSYQSSKKVSLCEYLY